MSGDKFSSKDTIGVFLKQQQPEKQNILRFKDISNVKISLKPLISTYTNTCRGTVGSSGYRLLLAYWDKKKEETLG